MTKYRTQFQSNEEETPEQKACDHNRVYSNFSTASIPPIRYWICSKCLLAGDSRTYAVAGTTYEELMERKRGLKP